MTSHPKASMTADTASVDPAVRRVMQGNRGRDTQPELAVRRILHRAGFRYRVDMRPVQDLPRRADIVFTRRRVAVFIDGCFWHGCPAHYRPAQVNAKRWQEKIDGNRRRDRDTNQRLVEEGWTVLRVWEHEPPADAVSRIVAALREADARKRVGRREAE